MLKILQARLQQYVIENFQMFKLVLENAEESEIKSPTSTGSSKSKRVPEKIYFCFTDYANAFDCVDHNRLWKFLKRRECQTTLSASLEICLQDKKQ